jgi:hypothetical protein
VLLDKLMPRHEFGEVHGIAVDAPPGRALEAAEQATPGELPFVRLLLAVRSLPAILARRRGLPTEKKSPLLGQMLDSGFVLLAREPGLELVAGVVAAPWKVGAPPVEVSDGGGFGAFDEPGYMKGAMNFSVEPLDGGTLLRTETRVLTTDPASRRAFGRYWRIIRPGSALIRRSWLRAAKRRAEGELSPSGAHGGDAYLRAAGPEENGALGSARAVLAAVFAGAGGAKLVFPKDRLLAPMPWAEDFSRGTVRLIGALELLGAAGLVLPRATSVLPALSPLAAGGLAAVMVGGFATHVRRGEYARSVSNVLLFALAAHVAYRGVARP